MKILFLLLFSFSLCYAQNTTDREDEFKAKNCKQVTKADIKVNVISGKARVIWDKYGNITYRHETYKGDVSMTYPGLFNFFADYDTKIKADSAITKLNLKDKTNEYKLTGDVNR